MSVLIAIALKSVIIAGVALGLVAAAQARSEAERSVDGTSSVAGAYVVAIAPLCDAALDGGNPGAVRPRNPQRGGAASSYCPLHGIGSGPAFYQPALGPRSLSVKPRHR